MKFGTLGLAGGATALVLFAAACAVNPTVSFGAPPAVAVEQLSLPPGFRATLYARVPNARQMALSPAGTLFVGNRDGGGGVYAVIDADKDGVGERVIELMRDLNSPNGVEFRDGALYVAEIHRITRYDNIEAVLKKLPANATRLTQKLQGTVVNDRYPRDGHHGWKYIRFGPDGWLYVPVGAPCNVCVSRDPRFASITRIKPDGSSLEIYAKGIRNTVGFDWDPKTKELWFTDNGRDWLGDEAPPDELNRAPRAGLNFGFPYCHGKDFVDPEFGKGKSCAEFEQPAVELGAHVAALGMKFYTGTMFPAEYRGDIFYAEHGSWNRSKKSGYRVMRVHMDAGKPQSPTPFAEGFLRSNGSVWGRPVDVLVMRDGSLLVSDDFAGAIYRIAYPGK